MTIILNDTFVTKFCLNMSYQSRVLLCLRNWYNMNLWLMQLSLVGEKCWYETIPFLKFLSLSLPPLMK